MPMDLICWRFVCLFWFCYRFGCGWQRMGSMSRWWLSVCCVFSFCELKQVKKTNDKTRRSACLTSVERESSMADGRVKSLRTATLDEANGWDADGGCDRITTSGSEWFAPSSGVSVGGGGGGGSGGGGSGCRTMTEPGNGLSTIFGDLEFVSSAAVCGRTLSTIRNRSIRPASAPLPPLDGSSGGGVCLSSSSTSTCSGGAAAG